MPFKLPCLTAILGCALFLPAVAQDKLDVKFGKIAPDEFRKTFPADTGASAIVLFDIGSTEFESENGWFQLVFKRHRRVRIVNKNGYDAASEMIPLYVSNTGEEKLLNLKGVTYNLEGGKIVEAKLEAKSVFTDKYDKRHSARKFTMPNVKEGSIVEYSYTITSDFLFNLQPWAFQSTAYPILWSEYKVNIPSWIEYIFLERGTLKPHIGDKRESSQKLFSFHLEGGSAGPSQTETYNIFMTQHRWVFKDVPVLEEEEFTTSMDNHLRAIRFQESAVRIPGANPKLIMSSWEKLFEEYMKSEYYGAVLLDNNNFLSDKVQELTKGAATDHDKAERIYNFVRDNYTCVSHSGVSTEGSIKTVFNRKNGTVAEINLLLAAMLTKAGLEAYPMLLSTRDNGTVYPFYPILDMFNYTIVACKKESGYDFLDASYPYLGFGKLDLSCYNGHARIMNREVQPWGFQPDSLKERKLTTVMITSDEKGTIRANWKQVPTYFESCHMREKIKEKGEDAYFKDAAKRFSGDITLENAKVEGLKDMSDPLHIEYEFNAQEDPKADVLYFSPMFAEAYKENPFKSAERLYPVEMPCVTDESFIMSMMLPEGYVVDELPKSARISYGDNEGLFEYLVADQGASIQLRCRVKMSRANFAPEEYESLRQFYDFIVKKQAEQIVLKKKK